MCQVNEVGEGIYRISVFDPQVGITFNQFLIDDDLPALVHTGTHHAFDAVRKAISTVLDPATLKYVIVPHFEADECGGMGRFVREAKESTLVCSEIGSAINLSAWDFSGPVKGVSRRRSHRPRQAQAAVSRDAARASLGFDDAGG